MDDPTIWTYTREEAIADGVLKDATLIAFVMGYRANVALTAECWSNCVTVPDSVPNDSEMDRLWEVLRSLRNAMPHILERPQVDFDVAVRTGVDAGELVRLKAIFEVVSDCDRMITIMLPTED